MIFHVHIDTSNFAIGAILAQPREKNMDFPISYASRQLNSAEQNYTTTKGEGLGMVYAVKKFWHYLFANKFTFFVDHQALLYLVNKPCSTGRLVRWFLILLEFDFTITVKKGTTHQRADHLSRLTHGEPPIWVDDDLSDAYLFNIEMVPKWSEPWIPLLSIAQIEIPRSLPNVTDQILLGGKFKLIAGRLYHQGKDQILRLCIEPSEQSYYLEQAHNSALGVH